MLKNKTKQRNKQQQQQQNKKENTPSVAKTNKVKLILLSNFSACDSKKPRFIKKQEADKLLSNL